MPNDDRLVPLERFLSRRFGGEQRGWRQLHFRSWLQRFDRLTDYLRELRNKEMSELKVNAPAGEPIVTMTRTFDAPRALVWKAMTEREHIARWWGASSFTAKVVVKTYDPRVGGEWRFESTGKDGNVFVFHGKFLEIRAPHRVIQTFGMEGMFEGKLIVEDMTLEELPDGKTRYRQISTYDSVADRDGMVASGMEGGARETLEQLAVVIAELAVAAQQQQ
jgi:uncharacterized protein YndB with AHSA1/START domain